MVGVGDLRSKSTCKAVVLVFPGVCGKLARAGVFGFSRMGQLSAVSVKCGGVVRPVEKSERGRGMESALMFGVERFAEIFNWSDGAG